MKQADYRNVVGQFIGDQALVTYSNIVEDQPGGRGAWKADVTGADIVVKEDGRWKYEVCRRDRDSRPHHARTEIGLTDDAA